MWPPVFLVLFPGMGCWECSSVAGIRLMHRFKAKLGKLTNMSLLSVFSLLVRTRWVISAAYTHPHSYVKRYESWKASSGSPRSRKSDQIPASSWDSVYENRAEEICSQQHCLSWRGEGLRAVAKGVCHKDATAAVEQTFLCLCQPFTCTTNLSFKYLVYKITI